MSLLRRRALLAASQASNSGGGGDNSGGGTEERDIIYLDINTKYIGPLGDALVAITSESLVPYDLSIGFLGSNGADSVIPYSLDFYYGSTFDVEQSFTVLTQEGVAPPDTILGVRSISPIDLNYRIIPSHICTISAYGLLAYLYTTNIDKIPISPDDMGANAEICPIKMVHSARILIDNTPLTRWIWYNYNGEILFRDLYAGAIFALNSYGDFYRWN